MLQRNLFYYASKHDLAGLKGLLTAEFVNVTNKSGQNLLHIVSGRSPSANIAKELINQGIFLDQQDEDGRTPLAYAAAWDRLEIGRLIVGAGGKLDIADKHGNQPLWVAAEKPKRCYELIEFFVEAGADPCHENLYGRSPMSVAIERGIDRLRKILAKNDS